MTWAPKSLVRAAPSVFFLDWICFCLKFFLVDSPHSGISSFLRSPLRFRFITDFQTTLWRALSPTMLSDLPGFPLKCWWTPLWSHSFCCLQTSLVWMSPMSLTSSRHSQAILTHDCSGLSGPGWLNTEHWIPVLWKSFLRQSHESGSPQSAFLKPKSLGLSWVWSYWFLRCPNRIFFIVWYKISGFFLMALISLVAGTSSATASNMLLFLPVCTSFKIFLFSFRSQVSL